MYYTSGLTVTFAGDTISQDEVNRDTAAIARIFACVNVFVVCAATVIYLLGRYETCGEFEIFIALLDVAMTASWVCVCLIPLELYCARRREEEAHGINREDGKQQLQASEKMSAKDKKDEKVPLLEDDTA